MVSNISYFNDAALDCNGSGVTVLGNILEGEDIPGNSTEDPQFVNADDDDYRLSPTSPAIDDGDLAAAGPLDIEGNPRPVGMGPDIGAYERQ